MEKDQFDDMQQQIDDHEDALSKLRGDFDLLQTAFYQGNFSSSQDFTKYSRFQGGLKVPHYDTLPATCNVGDIIEYGGVLKICSALNTWVSAGSQT